MRSLPLIALLVIASAPLLSACAGGASAPRIPIPDDHGLYAILSEDDLRRLDGNEAWEVRTWNTRADLSPSQQFVLYDPVLSSRGITDVEVDIWQVAWVRSAIREDGSAAPVEGSQWAVAPLESFRVPFHVRAVLDHPDMLHLVPRDPLAPGLYSLQLSQGPATRSARFGVQWSSVDKQEYSASHCVDRRADIRARFAPCGAAADSTASRDATRDGTHDGTHDSTSDFSISLGDPVKTTIAGRPILIVHGTITNDGSAPRRVPMLEATLQDRTGAVLLRQPLAAQLTELGAGQSAPFRTEFQDPPPGTARVNVNFAATSGAALQ